MKRILSITVLSLSAAGSWAQAPSADPLATPRIDKREANQQKRIEQGVASGQLTPREAKRMEARQAHIQTAEANAKADGKVTKEERAQLTHMQDKASKKIHHQKHDAQKVAPAK